MYLRGLCIAMAYGLLLVIYQTSNFVHPQCCIFKTSGRWRSYPRKAPHIMNNHWTCIYDTIMHQLPVNLFSFFLFIYWRRAFIHFPFQVIYSKFTLNPISDKILSWSLIKPNFVAWMTDKKTHKKNTKYTQQKPVAYQQLFSLLFNSNDNTVGFGLANKIFNLANNGPNNNNNNNNNKKIKKKSVQCRQVNDHKSAVFQQCFKLQLFAASKLDHISRYLLRTAH